MFYPEAHSLENPFSIFSVRRPGSLYSLIRFTDCTFTIYFEFYTYYMYILDSIYCLHY